MPKRAKLVQKFAWLFALFIVFVLIINCIITVIRCRSIYLDTQKSEMQEVSNYIVASLSKNYNVEEIVNYWIENRGNMDVRYDTDGLDQKYEEYISANENLNKEKATDEQKNKILKLIMECYYSAVTDDMGKIKSNYDFTYLSLFVPNNDNEEVLYLIDAAKDGETRDGVYIGFFGNTEVRTHKDSPVLWKTWETGETQDGLDHNNDMYGDTYSAYIPLKYNGETFGVIEACIDASALNSNILQGSLPIILLSGGLFAVCMVVILFIVRRTVVKPIVKLENEVNEYGKSKDIAISNNISRDKYPKDEIGSLALQVSDMIKEIDNHVRDIAKITSERERVETELKLATEIQASVLPKVSPDFSGFKEFELAARMKPAKEVGGDFYDFFFIDNNHLAFLVADVSGKGVPAALYMMRAKSQIQMLASIGLPLSDVLAETNKRLCLNNNAKMFVTVWIGCLDIRNGNLKYVNAGHNPPLIIKKSNDPMWIKEKSGIFPGAFKKSKYKQFELHMEKGDTLLLYTDGVTEAFNLVHEAYGNERLFDIMKSTDCSNTSQIINEIHKDIDDFTSSMEQYDDITMLCIRFNG